MYQKIYQLWGKIGKDRFWGDLFDVRFYLVGILFIIFDLEIAFLLPWAMNIKTISAVSFFSAVIFLFILLVGFIYEWKKGALDWE